MTRMSEKLTAVTRRSKVGFILVITLASLIAWRYWPHSPTGTSPKAGFNNEAAVHAGVATLADVPSYLSAPGTVVPSGNVVVVSRIDGQLQQVFFTEGQFVKQGQLLAQIDDRQYQATLKQYQGVLEQNQALLTNAKLTLARYRKLFAQDSLAKQDLESQIALTTQYQGQVKQAQAQIDNALINIDYAKITAPIAGKVGLRQVDPGNMVHGSDSNGLVTITNMQPADVTFSLPQSDIPQLAEQLKLQGRLPATVFDQDGTTPLAEGSVNYLSNRIDINTGSIELKGRFANQDEALFANQFVKLRLLLKTLHQVVVVPVQAIQISNQGSYVYIINQDNSVTRQKITAGVLYGSDKQVVVSGVTAGQKVVLDGIDRLTDKMKVRVVEMESTDPMKRNEAEQVMPANADRKTD